MENLFLIVKKGHPYSRGEVLPVITGKEEKTTIGRANIVSSPDISFSSPSISRQHALFFFKDGKYWIADQGSTNGTKVNGKIIAPDMNTALASGDIIMLADGEATLTVCFEKNELTVKLNSKTKNAILHFEEDLGIVIINNNKIHLPDKRYQLLKLLYERKNTIVEHDEILDVVWPDLPMADQTDIRQLINRLKGDIGNYKGYIKNIWGKGYFFDTSHEPINQGD